MRALFTIAASALAVSTEVTAPVDYRNQIAPLAAVDGGPEEDCALRSDTRPTHRKCSRSLVERISI